MLRRIIAPVTVPVTLADAQGHVRSDNANDASEATYLTALVGAAQEHTEKVLGRVFGEQTWELLLDAFPAGPINVPLPPLIAVESITYTDAAGQQQSWTDYAVDVPGGRIVPAYATFYPVARAVPNAVVVRFRCGYVATPEPLRAAILLLLGSLFENREAEQAVALHRNPAVDRLLAPYRAY